MSDTPNFLDLDDVAPAATLTVRIGGENHKLEPISVENFIANMQDQKKLETMAKAGETNDPDLISENIRVVVRMLTRSFPTMREETLTKQPLAKLWKLLEFSRNYDGSKAVENDAAAQAEQEAENPQTAG